MFTYFFGMLCVSTLCAGQIDYLKKPEAQNLFYQPDVIQLKSEADALVQK